MFIATDRHDLIDRLSALAALDPDFDAPGDDLEREFQELRLGLGRFE
jgi:hypothetical protein